MDDLELCLLSRWNFVAIAREFDRFAQAKANHAKRPQGLIYESEDRRVKIWIRTWGHVLEGAKTRLQFFQGQLGYDPGREKGLATLTRLYAEYLPDEAFTRELAHPSTNSLK